jgi:two-component system LytT family response regulator
MNDERLMVKVGNRYLFLNVNDIEWIESENKYSRIHVGENSYLIRSTLSNIEKRMDHNRFIRINRSVIINTECIKELVSFKYSKYLVILNNQKSWFWGPRFRNNLQKILEKAKIFNMLLFFMCLNINW